MPSPRKINQKEIRMEKTGVLDVSPERISRLEGWRKLAREDEDPPLESATDFLAEKELGDDDRIKVTGTLGALDDGTAVCFITDAVLAPAAVKAATAAKKTKKAKKATAKASRKPASGAKKGGAKKGGAKKSAGKKGAGNKAAGKKGGAKPSSGKPRRK